MKIHPIAFSVVLSMTALNALAAQSNLPGRTVDVKAGEYFIQAPDTIPAGLTTFRLTQVGDIATRREQVLRENLAPASPTNDPTRAFHMVWVVRLDSGHTVKEWYAAELEGKRPAWVVNLGGPASTDPPHTTNATMRLGPGNYALVCYIGSARQDLNRHHVRKGMFRALTVAAGDTTSPAVRSDVVAVITGEGLITLSGAIRAGTQTIKVVNETSKAHEFTVAKLGAGRTAQEALTWTRREGTTHPFTPRGGFSDVPSGATLWTTIAFEPGSYVLWTARTPATSASVIIPPSSSP